MGVDADDVEDFVSESAEDLTPLVGKNLKRLRTQRGLSLDRLAKLCGVSRAMLSQIELSQSTPTINVLWKIARSLDVPFSTLIVKSDSKETFVLKAGESKVLVSEDGKFRSRALFPFDVPRTVEFYELRIAPHSQEIAEPHPPGTKENLVVVQGSLAMKVGKRDYRLVKGDSIYFEADVAHAYVNGAAEEAVLYLVMTYRTAPRSA